MFIYFMNLVMQFIIDGYDKVEYINDSCPRRSQIKLN